MFVLVPPPPRMSPQQKNADEPLFFSDRADILSLSGYDAMRYGAMLLYLSAWWLWSLPQNFPFVWELTFTASYVVCWLVTPPRSQITIQKYNNQQGNLLVCSRGSPVLDLTGIDSWSACAYILQMVSYVSGARTILGGTSLVSHPFLSFRRAITANWCEVSAIWVAAWFSTILVISAK